MVTDEVREAWDCSTPRKRALSHMKPELVDLAQKAEFVRLAPGGTWLDWGSGGGALLCIADQRGAERMICVDVSRQALDELPGSACEQVRLHPEQLAAIEPGSVDVLCSFSCFQHFPSRDYGLAVLDEMRRLAKPGAHGYVQTRYYEPGDSYDPASYAALPYEQRLVRSCAYRVFEFWDALQHVGFIPLAVALEPSRHYAWYRFEAKP